MHWWTAALSLAGALVSWRWVLRPSWRLIQRARKFLADVHDASRGVSELSGDMRELAGSNVTLARVVVEELEQLRKDHRDLVELHIELEADFRRHEKGPHRVA